MVVSDMQVYRGGAIRKTAKTQIREGKENKKELCTGLNLRLASSEWRELKKKESLSLSHCGCHCSVSGSLSGEFS